MLQTLRTMECCHSFSTDNDHDLDGPPVVKVSQSSSLKSPISSIDMFPPFLPKPCPSLAARPICLLLAKKVSACYVDTVVVGDVAIGLERKRGTILWTHRRAKHAMLFMLLHVPTHTFVDVALNSLNNSSCHSLRYNQYFSPGTMDYS